MTLIMITTTRKWFNVCIWTVGKGIPYYINVSARTAGRRGEENTIVYFFRELGMYNYICHYRIIIYIHTKRYSRLAVRQFVLF